MTFDEAIKEINEAYDLVDYDMVYTIDNIILKLKEEYAPTIEMTKEQYKGLLFEGKGRETPHKNFLFMKNVQKLNSKNINIDILMSAFAHPETIKIVEKRNDI